MTTATPKPRAGEHVAPKFPNEDNPPFPAGSQCQHDEMEARTKRIANALMVEGAQKIDELITERDLLRERERELVEALESCLAAIGTMEAGLDPAALRLLAGIPAIEEKARNALGQEARSALAKHGR